jgi:hypothetical protein
VSIKVSPESEQDFEKLRKWGLGLEHLQERCTLCGTETRYWHRPSNSPVCPSCAEKHTVKELRAKLRNQG